MAVFALFLLLKFTLGLELHLSHGITWILDELN